MRSESEGKQECSTTQKKRKEALNEKQVGTRWWVLISTFVLFLSPRKQITPAAHTRNCNVYKRTHTHRCIYTWHSIQIDSVHRKKRRRTCSLTYVLAEEKGNLSSLSSLPVPGWPLDCCLSSSHWNWNCCSLTWRRSNYFVSVSRSEEPDYYVNKIKTCPRTTTNKNQMKILLIER